MPPSAKPDDVTGYFIGPYWVAIIIWNDVHIINIPEIKYATYGF
jgi:hypothetical protein